MSVGKGSIQRAAKAKDAAEKKEILTETAAEEKKVPVKETAKEAAPKKKAPAKKAAKAPAKKKDTVVAASVVSSDDINEKKFEAVSHIYCELPTYLL